MRSVKHGPQNVVNLSSVETKCCWACAAVQMTTVFVEVPQVLPGSANISLAIAIQQLLSSTNNFWSIYFIFFKFLDWTIYPTPPSILRHCTWVPQCSLAFGCHRSVGWPWSSSPWGVPYCSCRTTPSCRHKALLSSSGPDTLEKDSRLAKPNIAPVQWQAKLLVHPPRTCHMSHVACHVSCVTCHISRVPCHVSHVTCHFFFLFFYKVLKLIGGGSVINGAYPV